MKQICRRTFIEMSILALLAAAPSIRAETEEELIANLSSPDEGKVLSTMKRYKKLYQGSTKAFPTLKKLLTDSRLRVRRRAADMLGAFHAAVNEEDVKAICALLKEPGLEANKDVLKDLRKLQGSALAGAVPDILPCLKNPHSSLVREACRTLAVLGNKDVIPLIEPLLNSPEPGVKEVAQDAIAALRSKS
jgi:HEAT repeat protein